MGDKDADYHIDEDLEQIFHSDLQNLMLGHGDESHDDVIGDHLPEWLVGVIVVIAMLMLAFFVMIVTSLVKNRKKNRNSTNAGTASHAVCDDLESGKIGHNDGHGMKMTSFTSVSDSLTESSTCPQSVVDASDRDPLTPSCVISSQGCKNPLFVDDSDDNNSEEKAVANGSDGNKDKLTVSPVNRDASISNSECGNDVAGRSKATPNKYKPSSSKKSLTSAKSERRDGDRAPDSDGEGRKRLFASKAKGGSNISNKRGIINETSMSDNITPGSDEKCNLQGTGDATKAGNHVKELTEISSSLRLQDSESGICCDDSGVELSCQDSQLTDEAGGDENDSGIKKKCNNDLELEIAQSDVNFNNKSSSVFLHKKVNNKSVIPPSTDIHKESDLHTIACPQSPSVGCDHYMTGHIDQEVKRTEDDTQVDVSSTEDVRLLSEAEVSRDKAAASSQPQLNMRTAEEITIACDEVDHSYTPHSVDNHTNSAESSCYSTGVSLIATREITSESTAYEIATDMTSIRENSEETVDCKFLSTNL